LVARYICAEYTHQQPDHNSAVNLHHFTSPGCAEKMAVMMTFDLIVAMAARSQFGPKES
jgi:hypothetical protein